MHGRTSYGRQQECLVNNTRTSLFSTILFFPSYLSLPSSL